MDTEEIKNYSHHEEIIKNNLKHLKELLFPLATVNDKGENTIELDKPTGYIFCAVKNNGDNTGASLVLDHVSKRDVINLILTLFKSDDVSLKLYDVIKHASFNNPMLALEMLGDVHSRSKELTEIAAHALNEGTLKMSKDKNLTKEQKAENMLETAKRLMEILALAKNNK